MRPQLLVATLVLALAAPFLATAVSAQEASPAPPGPGGSAEFAVPVGDRSLHVVCAGTGGPPVLFEGGGPNSDGTSAALAPIQSDLAAALGTRFCTYDRANTGKSDPDPSGVRTYADDAADLHAVMTAGGVGCPCVVVGESMGGSIALLALAAHPSAFAGLVLLDAPYPGFLDEFLALAPAGSAEAAFGTDPYGGGQNEERVDQFAGFREVRLPATAPGIPAVVVVHGRGFPPPCNWEPPCSGAFPVQAYEDAWQAGEAKLATALGARLVVAEGVGHSIAEEKPQLVVGLVAEVIAAVRDPSSWSTPVASPSAETQ